MSKVNPKSSIFQLKAKVISNFNIKLNYFKLEVYAPLIAKYAQPGQFVNIRVNQTCYPLLRRPFSIHKVDDAKIEILYETKGEGTRILSQYKPHQTLDIIGPLGKGFTILDDRNLNILVGGGMGIAPLLFLANRIANQKTKGLLDSQKIILMGANTKKRILCEEEFKRLGFKVKFSTDDGTKGFKGKVTNLLKIFLNNQPPKSMLSMAVYACGPLPMLEEVCLICKKYKIFSEVSLETHLACGLGMCLGCVIKTKSGHKRICKDGPVFKTEEIIW